MPRGPYKRYLQDPSIPIPKRTLRWRRRQQQREAEIIPDREVSPPDQSSDDEDARSLLRQNDDDFRSPPRSSVSGRVSTSTDGHSSSSHQDSEEDSDEISDLSGSYVSNCIHSSESEDSPDFDEHDEVILENELQNVEAQNIRTPLYEGCRITMEESELLLMSYALRFGLSDKALEDLLQLIDIHLPFSVHGSLHVFQKKFPSSPAVDTYYYCPKPQCMRLINFVEDDDVICECSFLCNKTELKTQGCFFLQILLKEQLKRILNDPNISDKLRWETNDQCDVVSGEVYKNLIQRGIISKPDITLQWNTDGVQVFKSNKVQLWPIQVCINELPYKLRKDNIILCGLWFGPKKPNMNTYLQPLVEELTVLHREGLECEILGEKVNVKVHTLISSVDSQARAILQNIKLYRGEFGCSFCLHPGEEQAVGRGRARVYRGDLAALRTQDQHVNDVQEFLRTGERKNGIKGASVLLLLPNFMIIDSFVPDYLHCLLIGCVKTMVNWWLSGSNKDKSFYLGSPLKKQALDEVLLSIKPPSEVTRPPRTIVDCAMWKASEWKSFMLYYSLPMLFAVNMPAVYVNHWFLLVYSMSIFLSEKILSRETFRKAKSSIRKFVLDVEAVYEAPELLKFNFHLLLHVPKSVRDFGGLWGVSTFPYETYNGVLAKMFQGTHSVPQQICKTYLRSIALRERIPAVFDRNSNESAKNFFEKLAFFKSLSYLSVKYEGIVRLFGLPDKVNLNLVQQTAILEILEAEDVDFTNIQSFQRFILKGTLFHVNGYERMTKRINNVVLLRDERFLSITHILICTAVVPTRRKICVILGEHLLSTGNSLCENRELRIKSDDNLACVLVRESNVCVAVKPHDFSRKCVIVAHQNREYCCMPLVNSVERD